MQDPVFFTIVSRNYLAYAKTLMSSVAEVYPGARRYLCLADEPAGDPDLQSEQFQVVPIGDLDLPHLGSFTFRYDIMELNTAVKPYMFEWLRQRHPESGLVYLDPDILVVDRLRKIEEALGEGALLVLTPHLLDPLADDKNPDELAIMRSGVYNCGFAAINAGHRDSSRLIKWWADRLEFGAVVDLSNGLFTDQKWMDLAPGLFPDVAILRDRGYNVAYWNLGQRPVSCENGRYVAGGDPVAFVHFSGIVLSRPELFSKHQDRFRIDSIGGLRPLYEQYLGLLESNGHPVHAAKPYAFARFPDGEIITLAHRRVFRTLFDVGCEYEQPDPMAMDRELFNRPCAELPPSTRLPISRLMFEVWQGRTDLQRAFNIHVDSGREQFLRWFIAVAASEVGLASRYIEPIRAAYANGTRGAVEAQNPCPPVGVVGEGAGQQGSERHNVPGRVSRALGSRLFSFTNRLKGSPIAAGLYRRLPARWQGSVRRRVYAAAGIPLIPIDVAPKIPRATRRAPKMPPHTKGVNLVGYATGEFGVAENVRSYARALEGAGYPFLIRNFEVGVASRTGDQSMRHHFSDALDFPVTIFFINADQLPVAREYLGAAAFKGGYRIGYWLWELENFPTAWNASFDLVDEVWAPTEFVRAAIAKRTSKPVIKIPKAIEFEVPEGFGREHFHLDPQAFLFLCSYDFNSFATRKNPEAVIQAFRMAFPDKQANVRLILKSTNGERHPGQLEALRERIADDPRIELRNEFLTRTEMFGLQQCTDAYVSLHRAEGFGLGLAECMYLGKPVIATAYSGNMEFMTAENACLVDFKLVPVGDGEYPYWQGQHWADPSVEHAASYMRRLHGDREYGRRMGASAAESIRRQLSKQACAKAVADRLGDIAARHSS